MPLNPNLKKVMIIGSGPIVIGQAAEFDYAGTQACKTLKEAGLTVVLVNPNPATIMTDKDTADIIYIEPLTIKTLKRIILKEKPDSVLSTLGGQSGLTLAMQLAEEGFLAEHNVTLLGANLETINKAEDRQLFKDTMMEIGEPCIPSKVVFHLQDALDYAKEIGYAVIVRPAFTLGGSGGGIANNEKELTEIAENGLRLSPIHEILVEKCISGWKEIEFEAIRDSAGNAVTICSMENVDPVGVHTGDSIVVAPTVTLSDKEFQMLRSAALNIVNSLKIEGGCNCQFAMHPTSFEYAVIEVNPRVSRSSALASKATGFPIAKVATKIAIGYTLDEIKNEITGKTYACFEPSIDYIVVKLPKWPFDKFVYAKRKLGTQMKATGEVMAIAPSFEQALMKAVRGAEISLDTLRKPAFQLLSDAEVLVGVGAQTDERLFYVYEALCRGITVEEIHQITMIDNWFLYKFLRLATMEKQLRAGDTSAETYLSAKKMGYTDKAIVRLTGHEVANPASAAFKMVDTCAGEFSAETPYFYSTFDKANEAAEFKKHLKSDKPTVVVFGSGPIRIGQGIEFDYASVHCVRTLKKCGYDVVLVNNNPETVSTDFDTADRLYFEPLTPEDVKNILAVEKPVGVVVAFGGQTAIKLTKSLDKMGVKVFGTSPDSIDAAEDRERFDAILEELNIKRSKGDTVMTEDDAIKVANQLGYPVLLRPSYVLGGQNMIIAYDDADIREYMKIILAVGIENPILIDKYLSGIEVEVDAICDGDDILVPGIMEHIERAGVHSGDSIAVYPPWNINGEIMKKLLDSSRALALRLQTRGLINIQYVIHANEVYVIEANPRSSRTVPYISKVTGVPVVDLATRAMLGEKLKNMGYGVGLYKKPPYVAVKVPVFSFEKLTDVDNLMGPEMKSTGEVLGIGKNLEEALCKGLIAAGYHFEKKGGVIISVRDTDKVEIMDIARGFHALGFELYATEGTAKTLASASIPATIVKKLSEGNSQIIDLLESGKIQYVVSTSKKGRIPSRDSVKIRRKAIERGIPCLTALDTAMALINALGTKYSEDNFELVDINQLREKKQRLKLLKMRGTGSDYLYFDCFDTEIVSPESIAVILCNRTWSLGASGIVLIMRPTTDKADAKIKTFSADGTEGETGGNALRCVCKYLYDDKGIKKDTMRLETDNGVREMEVYAEDGAVISVRGSMGAAELNPRNIPVSLEGDQVISRQIKIGAEQYSVTCVSFGIPNAVIFLNNIECVDLEDLGQKFEHSPLFPSKVNLTVATVLDVNTVKIRVYERGNGETMSCGSAASSVAVAACLNGFCKKGEDITVKQKGGNLVVRYTDENVWVSGDAKKDFEGYVEL